MSASSVSWVNRFAWLGSVRQWHWISSAVCLIGMLLFAITGITLNHAAQIQSVPRTTTLEVQLPLHLQQQLVERAPQVTDLEPLPAEIYQWLSQEQRLRLPVASAEWSEDEVYLSLPRPGGDAWMTIDLRSGELLYEKTDRGWISYFNDLHKGRNTGLVWFWFLDIFALACVVFCITGLILLHRHAGHRPTTWPLVGLGLVLPWALILLFMH